MAGPIERGTKIGQYEVIEPLGKGGMASVYRAYQPSLDREIAIKLIAEQYATDNAFAERFRREARSIARLRHPNILTVYDAGEDRGQLYIAMELIEGDTLKEKVSGQPMAVDKALHYVAQVASALDYANKNGIIHRDVKPSNVLIDKDDRAVLSDFGIAKLAESNVQLTSTGTGVGTPDYMSPEQAMGEELDARSDQYSLGVMLFELLTGRTPYSGDTPIAVVMGHVSKPLPSPRQFNPAIPVKVENVLTRALSKKATDRYETSAAFSKALETAWRDSQASGASASQNDATIPITSSEVAIARPGSGPYIPEAEQLYAEARRLEQQNNFQGAFTTFSQLDGRFPRYRDVPTILEHYRTMGYAAPPTGTWAGGSSQASGGWVAPTQRTGSGPVIVPAAKKAFPVVPVLAAAGIIIVALVAILVIVLVGGGNNDNKETADRPVRETIAARLETEKPIVVPTNKPVIAAPPNAGPPPNGELPPGNQPPGNQFPPAGEPVKYVTYDQPDGKWSVEIPENWQATPEQDGINFTPKDAQDIYLGVYSDSLENISQGVGQNLVVDQLVKTFLQNYGAKFDREEKRKVNGVDTTVYFGTYTQNNVTINIRVVTLTKDTQVYLILLANQNVLPPQREAIYTHFLETFKPA